MWKKVKRGVAPSRGGLCNVMKKLHKTYDECGGKKYMGDGDETEGLKPFDALKIMVCKKLNLTRGAIRDLDNIPDSATESKVAKKTEVRRMLKLVKHDFGQMAEIQIKIATPRKFFKKKIDYKLVEAQKEDLNLVEKHINEVEDLYRQRYRLIKQKNKKKKKMKMLMGDSDSEDEDEIKNDEDLSEIALDSPENSHLPAIDITQAMLKVREKKSELQQGLGQFNDKLDAIKDQARDIGYQINESNKVMDDINFKVEKNTEAIDQLTKKTEKANKKIGKQTKLLLLIILMVLIIVAVIVGYVILVSTGILVNPVRNFV